MRNCNHRWPQSGHFLSKLGHFFSNSWKRAGETSPLPPLVTRLLPYCLELTFLICTLYQNLLKDFQCHSQCHFQFHQALLRFHCCQFLDLYGYISFGYFFPLLYLCKTLSFAHSLFKLMKKALDLPFSYLLTKKVDPGVSIENIIDIKRFNSLQKLLRVTPWVKRFVNNLKKKV